jgi:hypothetical protein
MPVRAAESKSRMGREIVRPRRSSRPVDCGSMSLSVTSDLLSKLGASTFDRHMASPQVTLEEHYASKSAEVAEAISAKALIYLDTKYWLRLRDVELGRPQHSLDTELLIALRAAVNRGTALCPFAADIFMEVIRQTDPATRLATARLIDELSQRATLRPEHERVEVEFKDFFLRICLRHRPAREAKSLIWCAPSYVLGLHYPTTNAFDEATLLALQKSFLDDMWRLGFADMAEKLGHAPTEFSSRAAAFAKRLNALHVAHASELKSLKQASVIEFRGFLDAYRPMIAEVLDRTLQDFRSQGIELPSWKELDVAAQQFSQLLVQVFQLGKLGANLPTMGIKASLYAAVRWDKQRKYKPNDSHDFGHAAAALPYHKIFATELSLAHLLKQMGLDRQYGATVVAQPGEFLDLVRVL